MSAWTCRQTARPPERLLHPVFEPHHGRASRADSGEKHAPAGDIDTAVVDSLEALDPGRPIREADIRVTHRHVCFGPTGDIVREEEAQVDNGINLKLASARIL